MGFGPVIIYGAGICGLTIAQGLRMSNIRFHIFEPLDESAFTSNRHITIGQSLTLMRQLLPEDAVNRLEALGQSQDNAISVLEGTSGQLLAHRQSSCQSMTIEKAQLQGLCKEGIDVKYQHALQDIEYTDDGNIYTIFTNGQRYWGSLLVGADGPLSLVRQMIFGAERAKYKLAGAEYVDLSLTCPPEVDRLMSSAGSTTIVGVAQDCAILLSAVDRPDPDRPSTWRFDIFLCWKKQNKSSRALSSQETLRTAKEKAARFEEVRFLAIGIFSNLQS